MPELGDREGGQGSADARVQVTAVWFALQTMNFTSVAGVGRLVHDSGHRAVCAGARVVHCFAKVTICVITSDPSLTGVLAILMR